jgi:hypothetical protein
MSNESETKALRECERLSRWSLEIEIGIVGVQRNRFANFDEEMIDRWNYISFKFFNLDDTHGCN